MLDVACGGGDTAVGVKRLAQRAGIAATVHGCDISAVAISYAAQRATEAKVEIGFFQADVLTEPLTDRYDVIVSTLFLHHLEAGQVVRLLRVLATRADLIVMDDLVRSVRGYLTAVLGTRLLTRSPVVHVDGPRSVRAAWTPAELLELARKAGLGGAKITRHFPQRMVLTWSRP